MNKNLYEKPKAQIAPGAWALPVVIIGRKKYFRDDRLQEFRNTKKPWERITFSQYENRHRNNQNINMR